MLKQFLKPIDNFLEKNPKLLNLVVGFFDKTSKLTHIVLFDIRVFFTIASLGFVIFFIETENLLIFSEFLREVGISKDNLQYGIVYILPLDIKLFLTFFLILMEIVILNMVLISLKSVRNKMISLYDVNIVKQRGYNSPTTSLARVGSIGVICLGGYCADLLYKKKEVESWKEVEIKRMDTSIKTGVPSNPTPTPWEHRQALVKGHVTLSVELKNKSD